MSLAWNESFAVHVKEIDTQHRQLFELVNNLGNAMREGKGKEILGKTLSSLVNYTKLHFAMEERLMMTHGYPDFVSHINQHTLLTQKVLEFMGEFERGRIGLSIPTMTFLESWLTNHIMVIDKELGKFLASKNIC